MSAHCASCGADIVYPTGTWPLGECPVCTPLGAIRDILDDESDDKLARIDAVVFSYHDVHKRRSAYQRTAWGPSHPSYDEMGQ